MPSERASDLVPPPETRIHPSPGSRHQVISNQIRFHGFFTVQFIRIFKIDLSNLCRPSENVFMLMELESKCSDEMPVSDSEYTTRICILYDGVQFYYIDESERTFMQGRYQQTRKRFLPMTCKLAHSVGMLLYRNEAEQLRKAANEFVDNPDLVIKYVKPVRATDHIDLHLIASGAII